MEINSRAWRSKDVRAELGVISMYVVVESIQKKAAAERTPKNINT